MLKIIVCGNELWDEAKQEFITVKEQTLQLEHSLISLSKWEARWNKPFLSKAEKSTNEMVDYVKCMTLTQNVDPNVYLCLTKDNFDQIRTYIEAPMTATILPKNTSVTGHRETVTSELIYYWMVALNIPAEFQKWHLNRLITLIGVCNVKNRTPNKRSKREILSDHAALNAARRKRR